MSNKPSLTFSLSDLAKLASTKKPEPKKPEPTTPGPRKMVPAIIFLEPGTIQTKDGENKDVLVLKIRKADKPTESFYSYTFSKGFTYHHVKKVGKSWKWDPKLAAYMIPVEDTELLFRGLGENFGGCQVDMNGKRQTIVHLERADLQPAAS